jgi:hypothetical protein
MVPSPRDHAVDGQPGVHLCVGKMVQTGDYSQSAQGWGWLVCIVGLQLLSACSCHRTVATVKEPSDVEQAGCTDAEVQCSLLLAASLTWAITGVTDSKCLLSIGAS